MGGSSWSDDHYADRTADRAARKAPTFAYDHAVRTGSAPRKVHDKLDPKGVTRESRDSDAHPNSVAIGVLFDVTGSMGDVPRIMQQKLPQLMGMLLRKGYIEDPQILFGAVGDVHSDQGSLQVGQFESGIEMEDDMTNFWLEGGGGGTYEESYQNGIYFFARHTSIDCYEKRGKKGYLFLIGDEKPYPHSTKQEIEKVFGDKIQGSHLTVEQLIAECQEKYNIFFIIPTEGTNHGKDNVLKARWEELLGAQNVILLDKNEAVCETIGLAIGLCEGTTDSARIVDDLKDVGASDAIIRTVSTGLDPLAKNTSLARVGTGSLPEATGTSGKSVRL